MFFVDTNYFIRFFTGVPKEQHQEVRQIFDQACAGKIKLVTSTAVFFETYWVAKSFYKYQPSEIKRLLLGILKMRFIQIENRELLVAAVSLFGDLNYDLEDAVNIAYAIEIQTEDFLTFDAKLKKKYLSLKAGR